ncbi:hypothetical protein AB4K20DRAFT_1869241 [Rhizopus microsporus]
MTNSDIFTIQTLEYDVIEHTNYRKESLLTVFVQTKEDLCASNHKIFQKSPFWSCLLVTEGLCIGSKIKGFLKYGGNWKLNKDSLYTTLLNSYRLVQGKNNKVRLKQVKGSFVCMHPKCQSICARKATHSRDMVSATAIALAGLSTLLVGVSFPEFNPRKSQLDTDKFEDLAAHFPQKKRRQA